MYKILFLLLALAVLCTAFRLLWLAFPRLKTRSGKVLTAVSFTALFSAFIGSDSYVRSIILYFLGNLHCRSYSCGVN